MSEVKEPVPASLGKVEKIQFNIPKVEDTTNDGGTGAAPAKTQAEIDTEAIAAKVNEGGVAETPAEIEAKRLAAEEEAKNKPVINTAPLTDEELKAEYEKRFPKQTELTEDQIKEKDAALEKRMLDFYISKGGNIEGFAAMKNVLATDLTVLSDAQLAKELKESNFTEEEIKLIKKERYFQVEQAEIDAIEDPEEKALAQKKLDYGKKKLEGKAAHTKKQAEKFFNTLKGVITEQDKQEADKVNLETLTAQQESEFSSNVEEHFKKVERKGTLQLGKANDEEIAPVEYDVPEDVITKAKDVLKDPVKRKQLLYNEDGKTLSPTKLSDLIFKAEMFESAAKTAYLTGGTRQVEILEKVLPFRSAHSIGLGGSTSLQGNKGKVVSAGKVQKVQRQRAV